MSSVDQVIEQLKVMTLMEATTLVAEIERVFGVDASAPVAGGVVSSAPAAEAAVEEEKSSFDVSLDAVPAEKRVAVLKVIRKLTSLGLADAKAFTTSLPKALKEGVDKAEAEEAKAALEAAGATVSLT
jgi:large subunit ribosomal protein L7/L12